MTRMSKSISQNTLLAMVLVSAIVGCKGSSSPGGGGDDSAHSDQNTATAAQPNAEQEGVVESSAGESSGQHIASATTGTIIIEERNGKTVFDAFFSQNAESQYHANPVDNITAVDSCSVSIVESKLNLSAPVELGAANSEAKYASVGAAVIIESRVGQFEALVKQQIGDITVYAPSARWKSVPLPDDATLSFNDASAFDQLGPVEVPPLLPLVWLAPETGVMPNPAAALRWEASLDELVQIKLRLSAIDFSDSQNPKVVTVACNLVDDGSFTLPDVYQQQLPNDDMGIVVYAIRERIQEVKVNSTSLTVVQLSYPAPLKP